MKYLLACGFVLLGNFIGLFSVQKTEHSHYEWHTCKIRIHSVTEVNNTEYDNYLPQCYEEIDNGTVHRWDTDLTKFGPPAKYFILYNFTNARSNEYDEFCDGWWWWWTIHTTDTEPEYMEDRSLFQYWKLFNTNFLYDQSQTTNLLNFYLDKQDSLYLVQRSRFSDSIHDSVPIQYLPVIFLSMLTQIISLSLWAMMLFHCANMFCPN